MPEYIFLSIAAYLAFIVKGITGFGNSIVMGSLFSFAIPNTLTSPVDLLMGIPTNSFIAWRGRKSISLKVVMPLSCAVMAGIVPGVFLLKAGNDRALKSVLGVVVMGMAAEMWLRAGKPQENKTQNKALLAVIGVVSGLVMGIYSIGVILVAYVSRTAGDRNSFRADLCCVFIVDNIFRLILYCVTGIITKEVVILTLTLLPAVAAGLFTGVAVDKRIKKEESITKIVVVLMAVMGMVLFVRNAFFMNDI